MSFSKAKIQRFNELGNDAPPPGAYDPKFDGKVKGAIIEKSDRFLDNKSISSADCSTSTVSGKSNATNSLFRVPQLPTKRLVVTKLTGLSRTKLNNSKSVIKNSNMKYASNQQLADLQVECLNKDKTIQEHERHIEEMKEDIRKLEVELEELRKKQDEIETQHVKDIEAMTKLHEDIINGYDDKHQTEMQRLHFQLLEISEEMKGEIPEQKNIEVELESVTDELSKGVKKMELEMFAKKEESKIKVETLERHIAELVNALKIVKHKLYIQIELLQKEKNQFDVCVANLTQERSHLESKLETRQNVILELQAQLSALQYELDELRAEYQKLTNNYMKQISDLTDKHKREIEHLKNDFVKEKEELLMQNEIYKTHESNMKTMVNKLEETNCSLVTDLKNLEKRHKDVTQRLQEVQNELKLSNEKHVSIIEKYKKDINDMKKAQAEKTLKQERILRDAADEYLKELDTLNMMKDRQIKEVKEISAKKIEEETVRIMKQAQEMIEKAEADNRDMLIACRNESKEQVKKMIVECDAKVSRLHVNTMFEETRSTVEEEMRLANERYKICLAHMETERIALDEKLLQKDAEITKLSMILEELRSSVETQASFSQSLQAELDKAESELAEKRQELRTLKDYIRTETAEMVAKKKRFEVIMIENQASVAALTDRLAQSNAEVERLQDEMKRSENNIHEHKELLNTMRNNSQIVHKQVETFMQNLDSHRELIEQHQLDNLSQLDSMKIILEKKIEFIKKTAADEIARLANDAKWQSVLNNELKSQVEQMSTKIIEAQNALLKLEEQNDAKDIDISRLELANKKLLEQLKSRDEALEENKQFLQEEATRYKSIIDKANSQIEKLSEKIKQLEKTEATAKETTLLLKKERIRWESSENALVQQLNEERTRRETAEEEVKKYITLSDDLKKDYEEFAERCADIIGHQNPKQRIKHVVRLKDKNCELEQELRTKTRLVEQQQKIIEKLKAEEKRSHWKGKENVGMVHSTPISSPHKALTPLRDRND
ncbi:hypothetical protein P5V15_014785 [Pogonomyrmex californicus]